MVAIKALACELPAKTDTPLARWQCPDLARAAVESGIVASISGTTIWRWLSTDAIKPWQHRSWIFPRDPDFGAKAARVLDLYARRFHDTPLRCDEFVISADEKTAIQARIRKHATTPPGPRRSMRVEHEYARGGALAYLAAWDVHRAKVFGPLRRRHHRHRAVRPARRAGDDLPALRLGPPGVLGGRQRLLPSRSGQHRPAPASLARSAPDPPSCARVLAQSSGDLLLRRAM